MRILFIDYETYYDDIYKLKNKSSGLIRTEYLNDRRFKAHGAAVSLDGEPDMWVTGDDLPDYFATYKDKIDAMCCHNGLFDHGITAKFYMGKEVFLLDTMSMAQGALSTRYPELSMSLGNLAKWAFPDDPSMHKWDGWLDEARGVRDLPPDVEARIGLYACQDNKVMRGLFRRLLLEEYPWQTALVDIHLTLAMGVYPQLRMNNIKAAKVHADVVALKEKTVVDLGITREMLRKNEVFAQLLRDEGIDPPTKVSEKTGKVGYAFAKTDDRMKELLDDDNLRVQALCEARLGEKSAQKETRAAVFARLPADLPIPTRYAAAHTGRHGGDEFNMQNLERGGDLRECVESRKGQAILVRDLAQIELRTNAWFCGEFWLVDLLRGGGDPYCILATRVFGREITKDDFDERYAGKQGELSCGYQSGDDRIFATLKRLDVKGASMALAKSIKVHYRSSHPAIVNTWEWLQKVALPVVAGMGEPFEHKGVWFEQGRVVLPSGRSLWYPELHVNEHGDWVYRVNPKRNKGSMWKKIFGGAFLENIIQALSYDIFMFHARMAFEKGKRMAMAVHDEMVFSVPAELAGYWDGVMDKIQRTNPAWCLDLPLKGEGGWSNNYREAKK